MLNLSITYSEKTSIYNATLVGDGTIIIREFDDLVELGKFVKNKEADRVHTENDAVKQYLKLMGIDIYENNVVESYTEVNFDNYIKVISDDALQLTNLLINNDYLFYLEDELDGKVKVWYNKLK